MTVATGTTNRRRSRIPRRFRNRTSRASSSNAWPSRLYAEALEQRVLLAFDPVPLELDLLSSTDGLVAQQQIVADWSIAGETDQYRIPLDPGASLSLFAQPPAGATARLDLFGPDDGLLSTVESVVGGQALVLPPIMTTTAGDYRLEVTSTSGVGEYSLDVLVNGVFEGESATGTSNNSIATAEDLTTAFLSAGPTGAIARVLGTADTSGDIFSFDLSDGVPAALRVQLETAGELFASPQSFSSSRNFDVQLRDVNNDGELDIVSMERRFNEAASGITVRLGDGTGAFGNPITTNLEFLRPARFAFGEFNGDSNIDIAAVDTLNSGSTLVFFGVGDGTFTFGPELDVPTAGVDIAVADVNEDGHDDVLSVDASTSNAVYFFASNGDGTFAARQDIAVGSRPATVDLADLDGDDHLDLLVNAVNLTTGIEELQVALGDGTGNFGPITGHELAAGSFATKIVDLNGDDALDVVLTASGRSNSIFGSQSQPFISILLNDGAGGFGERRDFNVGVLPTDIEVGDIDGDSDLDILVSLYRTSPFVGGSTMAVLRGDGAGGFTQNESDIIRTLGANRNFTVGDIDSDGDLDLVVADYISVTDSLSVILGFGSTARLDILDAAGAVVANASNVGSTISIDPQVLAGLSAGTYFARVTASTGEVDYRLNLADGLNLESEPNRASPQAIPTDGAVWGSIRGGDRSDFVGPQEIENNNNIETANDITGLLLPASDRSFAGRVTGQLSSFSDQDVFKIFAAPGDTIHLRWSSGNSFSANSIVLSDRDNRVVASAQTGTFGGSFVNLTYTVQDSDPAGAFYIRRGSRFSLSPYTLQVEIETDHLLLPPDQDNYTFDAVEGQVLTLSSLLPARGPDAPDNNLVPRFTLFAPDGTPVRSEAGNAADGVNTRIIHTVATGAGGTYRLEVSGNEPDQAGEYILLMGTEGSSSLHIVTTSPGDAQSIQAFPSTIRVDLSAPVDPASVDAADLLVNGVAADNVTVIDAATLEFDVTSAASGDGLHALSIAAGAFTTSTGTALSAYAGSFAVDSVRPTVVTTSFAPGAVLPAGDQTVILTLSEELARVDLGPEDVLLFEEITGTSFEPAQFLYRQADNTIRVDYADLGPGVYTLTLKSGPDAVRDLAGSTLDGAGDGTSSDFLLPFEIDLVEGEIPRPFNAVRPAGSLVWKQSVIGSFHASDDTDTYLIPIDGPPTDLSGRLSVRFRPLDPDMTVAIDVLNPTGAVVASASSVAIGSAILIQGVSTNQSGNWGIRLRNLPGSSTGLFEWDVVLNAVFEEEPETGISNDSAGQEESIDRSSVSIGVDAERWALLGQAELAGDRLSVTLSAGDVASFVLVAEEGAPGTFRNIEAQASPEATFDLRAFDLNGDGKDDLIGTTENGEVYALLSVGDGTFQLGFMETVGGFGGSMFLDVGDIDGDGHADIIVAEEFGAVGILFGQAGGLFEPFAEITSGGSTSALLLANVDGSAGLDILLGDRDNNAVRVLTNNGDRTFSEVPQSSSLSFTPRDLAVGDFDDDGDLDLVASGYSGYSGYYSSNIEPKLAILSGQGDGSFNSATEVELDNLPQGLAVADFDADGDLDIAVGGQTPPLGYYSSEVRDNHVAILIGRGDGTFASPTKYALPMGPSDLKSADVDGDGDMDLVVSMTDFATNFAEERRTLGVLANQGDGRFTFLQEEIVAKADQGNFESTVLAVGDWDGDGDVDAAVARDRRGADQPDSIEILLGTGGMTLELVGPTGELIALGAGSSATLHSVIADVVAETAGTYTARVVGSNGAAYSLVVTRNADFDQELNDIAPLAQDISDTHVALGSVEALGTERRGIDGAVRVGIIATSIGYAEVLDRLESFTSANFEPILVSPSAIDSAEELAPFDVLILLDSNVVRLEADIFGPAVRSWVESGGTLFVTGDAISFSNNDQPGVDELNAVSPVNLGAGLQFANQGFVVEQPGHPIAQGTTDFNLDRGFGFIDPADLQAGSTVVVAGENGDAALITREVGLGRSVYFLINTSDAFNLSFEEIDRLLNRSLLFLAGGGIDEYTLDVQGGENLIIRTRTPGAGPGEPTNNLTPRVQVFNELGFLVADSSATAADGRNVLITLAVPPTAEGAYRILVSADQGVGDYVLEVLGANKTLGPAPFVVESAPSVSAKLSEPPTSITLKLSESVRPDSVAATDLTIDGGASVVGVTLLDGRTVRFDVVVPDIGGTYSYTLEDGALVDLQGQASIPFNGSFEIDRTGPRIIGQTPTVQTVAPFSEIRFTFDEPIDAGLLSTDIVSSFTNPADDSILFRLQDVSVDGLDVVVRFTDQSDVGTYTMTLDASRIRDLAGNPLDQNQNGTGGETDDNYTTAVTIQSMDLTVNSLILASTTGLFGDTLDIDYTVENIGGDPAVESWVDRIWLSLDDSADGGTDVLLAEISTNDVRPLASLGSYTRSITVTLPLSASLLPGTFHILVETDAAHTQPELSETNNLAAEMLDLTLPPLPNLVVTDIALPLEALSTQQVPITWTIENQGTAAASGTWTDYVYLSDDANVGNDTFYGSFAFTGTIEAGSSVTRTQFITIPFQVNGPKFAVVHTDAENAVFEHLLETDNIAIDDQSINVLTTPFPNLVVESITPGINTVQSFDSFTVSFVVRNIGTGPTTASFWTDQVYLSPDETLDATDILLGSRTNLAFLNAGDFYTSSVTAQVPLVGEGDYHILVFTDAVGNRVDEFISNSDNVTVGPTIRIELPDPADLIVSSAAAPEFAFSGQPVDVNYAVQNIGTMRFFSGNWFDYVYLSTDETLDPSDILVGSRRVEFTDLVNDEYSGVIRANLPVGIQGDYFFIVHADATNRVNEIAFETNNTRSTTTATSVQLTPPPDLEIESFDLPSTVVAGLSLSASYTVANNGATRTPAQSWRDAIFLSADDQFDPASDFALFERFISFQAVPLLGIEGGLSVGDQYTISPTISVPVALEGTFFVFLVTDHRDDVFELDNANNVQLLGNTLTIVQQPPDLVVTDLTTDATAIAGQSLNVSWTVTNQGLRAAQGSSWVDRIVLSLDDTIGNNDDITLSSIARTQSLAVGESYTRSITAALPFGLPASVRIAVITDRDNRIFEGPGEANNISTLATVAVTTLSADLDVHDPQATPVGGRLDVAWQVTNIGSNATNQNYWYDRVVLSDNEVLGDADDVTLARVYHGGSLGVGQTYSVSRRLEVPTNLAGTKQVFVIVDDEGRVDEEGRTENNVISLGAVDIDALRFDVDLVVSDVMAANTVFSGQAFELSYTVRNIGTHIDPAMVPLHPELGTGQWVDSLYLSQDQVFDPQADIFVGRLNSSTSLFEDVVVGADTFQQFTRTATALVPSGLAGPWYLFVAIDRNNNIDEDVVRPSGETNNIEYDPTAMLITLPPPADLIVGSIVIPGDTPVGSAYTLEYSIENIGANTALGTWTDALYLSTDATFSPDDVPLFSRFHSIQDGAIPAGESQSYTVSRILPAVLPGEYFVVVRTDVFNILPEADNTNNLLVSLDQFRIDVPAIDIATGTGSANIDTNLLPGRTDEFLFQVHVEEGETLEIRADWIDVPPEFDPIIGADVLLPRQTVTSAFIGFERIPTSTAFDFSEATLLRSSQASGMAEPLIIPRTEAGTYYIRLFVRDTRFTFSDGVATERFDLVVTKLPFTVTAVDPTAIGNVGEATIEVIASEMALCNAFDLIMNGSVVRSAVRFTPDTVDRGFVTFDTSGLPAGEYELRVTNKDGVTASTPITIEEGQGPQPAFSLRGPGAVRLGTEYVAYANYGNSGGTDAIAPLLLLENLDSNPWGTSRDDMISRQYVQILGTSLEGEAGILRPESLGSVPVYFRPGDGGLGRFRLFTITADDARPLDFASIEPEVRPAGITDEDWAEVRGRLIERIGPTWGSYVRALAETATLLGQAGVRTSDVRLIFGELYRQARYPFEVNLSGAVVDQDDCLIIPGASLQFVDATGATVAVASTTDSGLFRARGVEPGNYTIIVNADGYERTIFTNVAVPSDERLVLELADEARITGEIEFPAGIPSNPEFLISAIDVSRPNDSAGIFTTTTSDPAFSLGGLPAGAYLVSINAEGFQPLTREVTIASQEVFDLGTLVATASSSIQGEVISTIAGLDLSQLRLAVSSDGTGTGRLVSVNAIGGFQVDGLDPGDYTLQVINLIEGIATPTMVTLTMGDELAGVVVAVDPGAVITGTVRNRDTLTPLSEVEVQVLSPDGSLTRVYTDATGVYRAEGLNFGLHEVSLITPDSQARRSIDVTSIMGTEFTADLSIASSTSISGLVTDAVGVAYVGATVQLFENGGRVLTGRTDDSGRYTFLLTRGGTFEIQASIDGASFAPVENIVVLAGQSIDQPIVAGTGSVRIAPRSGGALVPGASVLVEHLVEGQRYVAGSAFVGDSGEVFFDDFVAGDYLVTVNQGATAGAVASINVLEGLETQVDLDLMAYRSLRGVVLGDGGQALPSALLQLISTDTGRAILAGSADNGTYRFLNVLPGEYDLITIADGHQTLIERITVTDTSIHDINLTASTSAFVGSVVDADGEPLRVGVVQVFDEQDRLIDEASIQSDGSFELTGALGDNLTLKIVVPGHGEVIIESLSLAENEEVDLGTIEPEAIAINQGNAEVPIPTEIPTGEGFAVGDVALAAAGLPLASVDGFTTPTSWPADTSIEQLLAFIESASAESAAVPPPPGTPGWLSVLFGDQERRPDEVSVFDIPDESCEDCIVAKLDALDALGVQNAAWNVVEASDDAVDTQAWVVVGLAASEFFVVAGSIATLILSIEAIAAAAGVSLTAAGGAAVGTVATSGTTIAVNTVYSLVQIASAGYGLQQSISNAIDAVDIDTVSAQLAQAGNDLSGLITLATEFATAIAGGLNAPGTAGVGGLGGAGNILGLLANFQIILDSITFTQTRAAIDYLRDLKNQLDADIATYNQAVDVAKERLQIAINCLIQHDCLDDDGSGGGNGNGNNNNNNSSDNEDPVNPPTPPPPPTPPIPYVPVQVRSVDPNDITGPAGFGDENWVPASDPLVYQIRFENESDATAPAQRVTITQTLDDDFDPRTFRVEDFGWAGRRIEVGGDLPFFQGRIDLDDGSGFVLDVTILVDVLTSELTWILQTIDPSTGAAPADALAGFLPPNDENGIGEGFVNYTVRPRSDASTGARLDAEASIIFDVNEPIATPPIFHTLDAVAPTSQVEPLPVSTLETSFEVSWTGQDDDAGSALADFSIYVSTDGGPFVPWLERTPQTSATYFGEVGKRYAFASIARDNAGNVEQLPSVPDAVIDVIDDAAPKLLIQGPAQASRRADVEFTFVVEGLDLPAAGYFVILTDIGANSDTELLTVGPSGVTRTIAFETLGTQTVNARILDVDGTVLATGTTTIEIVSGFARPNANNPPVNDLIYGGSSGDDWIIVEEVDATTIRVRQLDPMGIETSSETFTGITGGIEVSAGDGDDIVDASTLLTKSITIIGGAGNDTLRAGAGDDWINGDAPYAIGNDEIDAGPGNDIIYADGAEGIDASDTLGQDTIRGGDGNDLIYADGAEGSNDDFIDAGAGNDTVQADGEDPTYENGTFGVDTILGGEGDDLILGDGSRSADDFIDGGAGRDVIVGDRAFESTHPPEGGKDSITGGTGEDLIIAGSFAGSSVFSLDAIREEWLSERTYLERTANILGTGTGPRANGDQFLQAGVNVRNDRSSTDPLASATDQVMGDADQDFFFADSVDDVLADLEEVELLIQL